MKNNIYALIISFLLRISISSAQLIFMKNNISSIMKNNIYALIIISFQLIDDANWFWFIKPIQRLLKFNILLHIYEK